MFKRLLKKSEYSEQVAIVNYIKYKYLNILFTASAGGMRTSIGVAKKMKAMGYARGTPDLWIMESKSGFNGLIIELKREKGGVLSREQKYWLSELTKRNYLAVCCYGFEDAKETIDKYFNQCQSK